LFAPEKNLVRYSDGSRGRGRGYLCRAKEIAAGSRDVKFSDGKSRVRTTMLRWESLRDAIETRAGQEVGRSPRY
jgi:hypothetical protein